MLAVDDSVLILLAAGRSSRFADARSKLEQDVAGTPLGLYAARALAAVPFKARLAIVGPDSLDYDALGFETIPNPDRDHGMATSVRLGVARAMALGATSAVIALADMPRVTAGHVRRLFAASDGAMSVVASSDERGAKPPALFGAGRFAVLLDLTGDQGARGLLKTGRHVAAGPGELVDIDTVEQLAALRAAAG